MAQPSISIQVLSMFGALLILIAYMGHQGKWMSAERPAYNILNAIGSGILSYVALRPLQVGFAVLESAWAVISLMALYRCMNGGTVKP